MENCVELTDFAKKCRVCGDKTLVHFNFNGLSCQSCKKFFRRNAYRHEDLLCLKQSKCHIEKISRKCCKRCRLDKCFMIGMKKEFINNVELRKNYNELLYNEIEIKSKLDQNDELFYLNSYEQECIEAVKKAISVMSFCDRSNVEIIGEAFNLAEVVNRPGMYVQKIIKLCKGIGAFSCLKQTDQLLLLKSFYPQITSVYAAFIYSLETDGFNVVVDEKERKGIFVKMDHKDLKNKDMVTTYRKFTQSLHVEMANDAIIRDLITVLLLFRPHKVQISCPEYIRYNHLFYCHLLQRYLYSKLQDQIEANKKYSIIMNILQDVGNVSDIIREVYLNEIPESDQISQVLVELYNLI